MDWHKNSSLSVDDKCASSSDIRYSNQQSDRLEDAEWPLIEEYIWSGMVVGGRTTKGHEEDGGNAIKINAVCFIDQ